MPQYSDDLWLGAAPGPQGNPGLPANQQLATPFPISQGVGPLGRIFVFDIVPAALSTTAVAAAQAIAGAANAIINGASAAGGVATFDYPRCCQMVSSNAGDTTQTVTLTGTDYYGRAQTERKTLNGTTPVIFSKAFKTVTQAAVSAVMTGNLSIGNTDKFGLPYRVTNVAYIASVKWNSTLASDAGTFTAADQTSPATNATTDVRGLYQPSNAADGSKRLVMGIMLPAIAAGPTATQVGAIGVTPA